MVAERHGGSATDPILTPEFDESPVPILPLVLRTPQIPDTGERKLLRELIWEALHCLQGIGIPETGKTRADLQRDAYEWFKARRDDSYSFVWCCHCLGLDPDYVREHMFSNPRQVSRRRCA